MIAGIVTGFTVTLLVSLVVLSLTILALWDE